MEPGLASVGYTGIPPGRLPVGILPSAGHLSIGGTFRASAGHWVAQYYTTAGRIWGQDVGKDGERERERKREKFIDNQIDD
jgi:hypothetical protein